MDVEIIPIKYNKTAVDKDGITHNVDTKEEHTAFQVSITEYYNIEDPDILLSSILRDLDRLTDCLQCIQANRACAQNNNNNNVAPLINYLQNIKKEKSSAKIKDSTIEQEL